MTDATPEVGSERASGPGAATAALNGVLGNLTKRGDIALALGIVCILVVLLLPIRA